MTTQPASREPRSGEDQYADALAEHTSHIVRCAWCSEAATLSSDPDLDAWTDDKGVSHYARAPSSGPDLREALDKLPVFALVDSPGLDFVLLDDVRAALERTVR